MTKNELIGAVAKSVKDSALSKRALPPKPADGTGLVAVAFNSEKEIEVAGAMTHPPAVYTPIKLWYI